MAKRRLTKAEKNMITNLMQNAPIVDSIEEALCKAYYEYIQDKLHDISRSSFDPLYDLYHQAKTDKEKEKFGYMLDMQGCLNQWIKCQVLLANLDCLDMDFDDFIFFCE